MALGSFGWQSNRILLGDQMLFGKRKRIVKRILIVEDEPLTAFDNEVMLADMGYEVVATLDSFDQAIALIDREDVDLVLSDVRLTGKRSGVDLANAAANRGIPVLFSTGRDLPAQAKSKAIGCLKKPYSERQLKNALEAVDKLLGGETVKAPKGLELFPPADS
jgi:DNA-binding NtrC family response regulator